MRLTRAVAFVRSRFFAFIQHTRKSLKRVALASLLCCIPLTAYATSPESSNTSLLLPLTFEPNRGQAPAEALYLARSAEGSILLNKTGIVALLGSGQDTKTLRIRLVGAEQNSRIIAEEATGGIANYYGKGKRLESIPFYTRVRYQNVYDGTDIVFHGRTGRLEFDFELAPAADPRNILIDASDADSVAVQDDKSLLLSIGGKQIQMLAPEAYQESDGHRVAVQASYRLSGKNITFNLGSYDKRKPLIIDPVVAYTALLSVNNSINVAAGFSDATGNFYLAGDTKATNFPVTAGSSPTGEQSSAFLTKINPAGTTILVSTIVESASANSIASDPSGNLYLAGFAYNGFTPTTGAVTSCNFSCNGFAAKFNSAGQMIYSTALSSGGVTPYAIAADSSGSAYLTGIASDDSLATVNAFQPQFLGSICLGCSNAFFAKLTPDGSGYEFASYFGVGHGKSIAVDQGGNIFLAGVGVVPLVNPLQVDSAGVFISKFSPDAQSLLFSTQFGSGGEQLGGMALGSDGTVYLAGSTTYAGFPFTLNAFRLPVYIQNGDNYMFAAAMKPDFSGLVYSTYLGRGIVQAVALGGDSKLHVAGHFISEPLMLKNPVGSDGDSGGFVVSIDKTGSLSTATQYGGRYAMQVPNALGVDASGNIYVAGAASILSAPVNIGTGDAYLAQQAALHFNTAFIAKISTANVPQVGFSLYLPSQVLRNVGSAPLTIQSMTVASPGTKLATSCGSSLPAGASCIVTLTPYGTLTINSNAQPSPQTYVPLTTHSNNISLWPDRGYLYFGPQYRGSQSAAQSIRLWNVSTSSAAIAGIFTNGSLTQTNDCPSTLEPQEFCTIQASTIAYPTSDGGVLSVASPSTTILVPATVSYTNSPISTSVAGINFGAQLVGKTSLYRVVNVTNSGDSTLSPSVSLSGASEFSIVGNTCTAALATRASCAIAVMFAPIINGPRSAELLLASGSASAKVQLGGSGTMNSAIRVDPLGLTFYNAMVGKTTYPQSVTLTNTSGSPVVVTGIQFSSPHYVQTNTCQSAIPSAGTCTIQVSMQPLDVVTDTSTLTITFDTAAEQVISLSGKSVLPIEVKPGGLNFFDYTPVGVDSNPRWMYLANGYSQGDLTDYTLTITADFRILENHCPNPIPKWTGCAILLVFHPEKPGAQEGALTVSFPNTYAKGVVTLLGTAASAGVKISPETIDFPETMATTKSAPRMITLFNPQPFAVTIPQPYLSGQYFEFTHDCGTIQSGASCDIPVVFAPTTTGFVNANLFFQNGGDPPTTIRVDVTGVGTAAPGLSVSASRHTFDPVDAGTSSAPFILKVTNQGPHAVPLPLLTMSGTNASDFTATPSGACAEIASQASCDLEVVFAPKKLGTHTAELTLPSGGTNSYTIRVRLEGWGSDFSLDTSAGTSRSITNGQAATFSLPVERFGYAGEIQVQCVANGASYGTCTANPSVMPASSGSGRTTVTLSIGPATSASTEQPSRARWPLALALILPGFFLVIGTARRRKTFATFLLALCVIGVGSCGGGGGGTHPPPPPQATTYRYTVAFTGSLAHTVNLTVTVNPQ
jgi:hypothetical protein